MGKYLFQSEPSASEAVRSLRRVKCMPGNTNHLRVASCGIFEGLCLPVLESAKLCSGVDQQCQMETDWCSVVIHCGNEAQYMHGSGGFSLLRHRHQANILCALWSSPLLTYPPGLK